MKCSESEFLKINVIFFILGCSSRVANCKLSSNFLRTLHFSKITFENSQEISHSIFYIFEHFPHILKNNFECDRNVPLEQYLYEFWIIDSLVELGFGLTFEPQVKKRHLSSYIIRTSLTTISTVSSLRICHNYFWLKLRKTKNPVSIRLYISLGNNESHKGHSPKSM